MYPSRIKFWSEIYDYDYDFMPKNLSLFLYWRKFMPAHCSTKRNRRTKKIKCQNWAIYNYLTHTYNRPQVGYCNLSCGARFSWIDTMQHGRRKVHKRILVIWAAQLGPNGQLSCLQNILNYETIIYFKWNDIIWRAFWCTKKIWYI